MNKDIWAIQKAEINVHGIALRCSTGMTEFEIAREGDYVKITIDGKTKFTVDHA